MRTRFRVRTLASVTVAALIGSVIALAAPSAALAAPGELSISGTVDGGYIAAGLGRAEAYELVDDSWQSVAFDDIATNGDYTITGLGAGTYRVSFTDISGSDVSGGVESSWWKEWWDDGLTSDTGDDVVLTTDSVTGVDADLDTVDGVYSWPDATGTLRVGQKLTATPGVWPEAARASLEYEWYADDEYVGSGKTLTLTSAHRGTDISVTVWGEKYPNRWEGKDSGTIGTVAAGVLTTATPTVSGTVAVGSKLTAKPGTWTSGTAFSYQWYASGTAIRGATASTFTLTTAQRAKTITVQVTGKKSGYTSVSKTATSTARVATAATPAISGTARIGSKLTAKTGTWTTGTTFSYRWYANGTAITGATRSTFTVTRSQAGKAITVTVTGKKSGYATVSKTSKATAKVLATATPSISGTAKVGKKLVAKTGTWTTGTTFSYQWYLNGKAISGATKSSFTVKASHLGKRFTVKVTGKKSGYVSAVRTSAATTSVTYPSSTAPASDGSCPSWAPIKGNHSSSGDWIYHVPTGRSYKVTDPEECFRTEAAAVAAGYRKAKN